MRPLKDLRYWLWVATVLLGTCIFVVAVNAVWVNYSVRRWCSEVCRGKELVICVPEANPPLVACRNAGKIEVERKP